MKNIVVFILLAASASGYAQVDTSFVFSTTKPYGTLDIRIAKSSTRYYYLQENKTVSFREDGGVKTDTYRDMTSWDSSPYTQGNMRERAGTSDLFIMNYRLLFPVGYQPAYSEGYPMIVMMHGAGERANCWDLTCYWGDRSWRPLTNDPPAPTSSSHQLLNNDHNLSHGGKQHLDARNLAGNRLPGDPSLSARAFPGLVLFAQNLNGWDTGPTQDLIKLVRLVAKKYNVDPNRIYLHGLSNGGIATYNALKRAPWLFAAALPMSAPTESGIISQGLLPEVAHVPLWTFQGGQDTEPTPQRTEGYVRSFREAGADVRYTLYPNLGHGTWNSAYGEPDFFSWMRAKSKTQIHVFFGNTSICGTTGEGVKLGLANGFLAYQWEKDGAIISGATGHEYVATQPGVYRARFSRESRTPSGTQWEEWSSSVTVTGSSSTQAAIVPLTTTHLRGPDNAEPNTIRLKSSAKADRYLWYKNGTLIDIPLNNMDDTVSVYTITSTSTTNNGAYTLRTAGLDGCASPVSDPINLFFNNSAPLLSDNNIPTSFRLVSVTGSTATLAWNDVSSVEQAYEIWRRAPGETFIMAGRTSANAVTFTDRGLIPSTAYEYKIRALNNQGRSKYAPADSPETNLVVTTAADTQAPTAPANVRVVRNTTSSISLAWDASTDNNGAVSHYVIYYGSQSASTGSPATNFTITGLPINASYNITVKAVDHGNLFSPASTPITGTTTVTGLWYGHSTGAWTDLDQITNWNQPEFTGWVPNITLEPRTQEEFFNFEFTGYLFIETGGTYTFFLNSDDGSRLFIDGNAVVDFDGLHGRSTANDGFGVNSMPVTLSAGPHEIRVIFFEYTEGQSLDVAYQGADTKNVKMLIPDAAFRSGEPSGGSNSMPVVNITSPENDQQFVGPANISITATASDADGSVAKVEFYNGAAKLGEDLSTPYAFAWNNVTTGNYSVVVKAIDNVGGASSATVNISVVSGSSCAGSGTIQAEVWTGIPGNDIGTIPVNTTPTSITDLTSFETPSNIGDSYGSRVRGYLCVPVTGTYTFWIATDDTGELWLSTDENPLNKARIAYVPSWARPREWERYPSQKSVAINLEAGRKYYVEALLKEDRGGDNLAVGWQLPDGTLQRPIAGDHLSPFGGSGGSSSVVTITSPEDGQSFNAPATVQITASASIDEGNITKVEFYNGDTKLGEDLTSPYSYTWSDVTAGNYSVIAKAVDDAGGIATSTVDISVVSGTACVGTGVLQAEMWAGVSGTKVSLIPQDTPPSSVFDINLFETPNNMGDNYGVRVRGYVCVPTSGDYVFWIATDDTGELWLSTDESSTNKARIAYVDGWTTPRQWDKYTSQQSAPIALVAGQRYYIEALMKEGAGGDNLAVGWQLPGGTLERPIAGNHLVPLNAGGNQSPVVAITNPTDGQSFIAPASVDIAATASDNDGTITKVEFYNGANKIGEDLTSPYTFTWSNVAMGNYVVTAKAIDDAGGSTSASVNISVSDGSACSATGTMQMEVWTGVTGWRISDVPVNSPPNSVTDIYSFQTPSNFGDNYAARVRGFLCVPETGSYTFWMSSDDMSELWLSTSSDPASKVRIAYVSGWTYPLQWDRYTTQKSALIHLVAGQRYYVEALLKEGTSADHLAVGWQLPGGTLERPIGANRISPFVSSTTTTTFAMTTMAGEPEAAMTEDLTEYPDGESFQLFPNPATSGVGELTISGYQETVGPRETTIEVLRMTGDRVYSGKVSCKAGCEEFSLSIDRELRPGVYIVNVESNGKRQSKRLVVK